MTTTKGQANGLNLCIALQKNNEKIKAYLETVLLFKLNSSLIHRDLLEQRSR